MTPLAYKLVSTGMKDVGVRELMTDVHCFDMTAVEELMHDLSVSLQESGGVGTEGLMFLPAPKTWIEWCGTTAYHLSEEDEDGFTIKVVLRDKPATKVWKYGWFNKKTMSIDLAIRLESAGPALASTLYACLCMINTPRIVGRRVHMPNRTLEAKMLKTLGVYGKWPLLAWTEIELKVRDMGIVSEEDVEAHLTGKRALHFVRKHIRIRCGKLEYVRAHWRGDGSLGIKQSRYKVTP